MKTVKVKGSAIVFLFILSLQSFGQGDGYMYKRELGSPKPGWYQIEFPNDIYGKLNIDFSDIRIIGIESDGDTIEAPYVLDVMADDYVNNRIEFKLINKVHNGSGYYYTFEQADNQYINQIDLEFSRKNFDWLVDLEGSNDQKEWFNIIEHKRILSIQNEHTSYAFTKLHFGDAGYQYFRLRIPATKKPQLIRAILSKNTIVKGEKVDRGLCHYIIVEDKKAHQTIMTIDLKGHLPISLLTLEIKDTIDYYRPVRLSYVRDSVHTEKGWKYVYNTLKTDVISSLEPARFTFPNTIAKKIRLKISNGDNEPLHITGNKIYGDVHRLKVRITNPATYYLVYGKRNSKVPNYDISRFSDHIPANPQKLDLKKEETVKQNDKKSQPQLFENNWWLWVVMVFTILILGWFSFKMIRSK